MICENEAYNKTFQVSIGNDYYTYDDTIDEWLNLIDLEDKDIGDLILKKRIEIKDRYPNCFFNVNGIQDIKLSLLFLLYILVFIHFSN